MATAAEAESDSKTNSESQLRCLVCLDYYEEPKLLPCSHVACYKCLLSWLQANGMPRTCPECRRQITDNEFCRLPASLTPKEICDALPTELNLQLLVKCCRKLEGPHVCEKCGQEAYSLCVTCLVKLCRACRRKHAKAVNKKVAKAVAKREAAVKKAGTLDLGLDADHPHVPYVPPKRHLIEPLSDTLDYTFVAKHGAAKCRCQRVEDHWVTHYCNTHDRSLCVACLKEEHAQCEVTTLAAKAAQARKELAESRDRLRQKDVQLQQEYEQLKMKEGEVTRKGRILQAELDGIMDRMLTRLQVAKDKLSRDITESESLPTVQRVSHQSSLLQTFRANMKDLLSLDDAEELVQRFGEYSQQTIKEVEGRRDAVLGQKSQCPPSCVHNPRHQHHHVQQQENRSRRQPDISALRSMTEYLHSELEEAMDTLEHSLLCQGIDDVTNTDNTSEPSSDIRNAESNSTGRTYQKLISDID